MCSSLCAIVLIGALGVCKSATAAETQTCGVTVDVTDVDPNGTNVRAAPDGTVIATLKNPGEGWIEVHVTGESGDWYRIDRATLIDVDGTSGDRTIFHGTGWLHRSVVGVSGMQNGGAIYKEHGEKSPKIDPHAAGDQTVTLLGCWGSFLKVRVRKGTGWTKEACTNMNTTCA